MGIEPPTLAGVVNRMERDGWIVKTNCEDDRRRCRLHPTSKAEAIWARSVAIAHEVRAQAVAGISQADLDTLHRVCLAIRDNLNAVSSVADADSIECVDADALRREIRAIQSM